MRLRVLNLLLAAVAVTAGCNGGAGPSVSSPDDAKRAADVSAAVGAPTTPTRKFSAREQRKIDRMKVAPASPQ